VLDPAALDPEPAALAAELVGIGRRVRDAVRARLAGGTSPELAAVVRAEGGDHIFGVDEVADRVIVAALDDLGRRWSGRWVMEGFAEPLPVGDGAGPWRFLCDPLDGTRPLLAGKRSAWVLIGAGRGATTLEQLELSVVVEVPTGRAALARTVWADRHGRIEADDEDLRTGVRVPVRLQPRRGADIEHSFVTVVRFAPGRGEVIGRWADRHLAGLVVFDDLVPCSAGQLMGLACGSDTAVFDPRPVLAPGTMAAHPYDLAGLLVARAAGVVVEALPAGPLDVPLTVDHPVAWAGYANPVVAERLRVHTIDPAP
jgi:fructose-1,6-bisphosphatase/inositol monophosphatase family enzyme